LLLPTLLVGVSGLVVTTGQPLEFDVLDVGGGVVGLLLVCAIFPVSLADKYWATTKDMALTLFALASVLDLYISCFTWLHWSVSQHDSAAYALGQLNRVDAAYFTFATFSTTGFGDIRATSDAARIAVLVQMVSGFFLLAVAVVLVLNRVVLMWSVGKPVKSENNRTTTDLVADALRTGDTETGY
jgi:hypothetical protein